MKNNKPSPVKEHQIGVPNECNTLDSAHELINSLGIEMWRDKDYPETMMTRIPIGIALRIFSRNESNCDDLMSEIHQILLDKDTPSLIVRLANLQRFVNDVSIFTAFREITFNAVGN